MDAEHDPIDALAEAARARHAEHRAALAALQQFVAALYGAVEALAQELLLREAPGVAPARRIARGGLPLLRFQWLGAHLALVPHDETALPPEGYGARLRGRAGRLLLFRTMGPDDTAGQVLRDYLVDADGAWHCRGVGHAGDHEGLSAAAARAHAVQLFADLHAGLQEQWLDAAQMRAFDDPDQDRALGFHAE